MLHDGGNASFATTLLGVLRDSPELTVGDNEPYSMDGIDHTVPRHAYPERLPYAELEVRQDLIANAAGQREWCERIAAALQRASGEAS